MKETLGFTNMKRFKLLPLLAIIPVLASCSGGNASFDDFLAKAETLSNAPLYPYYRVQGMMDFNKEVLEVDEVFDKNPGVDTFVPHSRFNDGFYNMSLDNAESSGNITIYGMSSKSYWLRAPLRITEDNYYTTVASDNGNGTYNGIAIEINYNSGVIDGLGEEYSMPTITKKDKADLNTIILSYSKGDEEVAIELTRSTEVDETVFYDGTWKAEGIELVLHQGKRENRTCAHYLIEHIITSYMDLDGSANPSKNNMSYELLSDGGFAFVGNAVHTNIKVDNYPYYPDFNTHPELGDWDEDDPLPCFKNLVNAKVNVRFEYNSEGWLVKESLESLGYDYNVATDAQISLIANYTYKFSD